MIRLKDNSKITSNRSELQKEKNKTLENLKQISKDYEILLKERNKEIITYFENHSGEDLAEGVKNGKLPKWKLIERESESKEDFFIKAALKYADEQNISDKELVIKISEIILKNNSPSINQYLLIRLMWKIGKEEGHFCLDTLEKLLRNILQFEKVKGREEYYLESYIDIWNYDTDKLIPIDILESIILLEPKIGSPYGALIKAVSYLSMHPKEKSERILAKARNTKSYMEDEYYKEWID